MVDLLSLFPDPLGARPTSKNTDDVLSGVQGSGAASSPAPGQAEPIQAGTSPQSAPATNGASTSAASGSAASGPALPSTANSVQPNSSSSGASTSPAVQVADATGDSPIPPETNLGLMAGEPAFDGLLVSWNPQANAEERANARAAFGLSLREEIHTEAMRANGAGPLEWLSLAPGRSAEEVLRQLAHRPGVSFAEKNWVLQTQATSNDPGVTNGNLWGMYGESSSPANAYGSQAAEAWSRGFTGSDSVVVGIIDEGYQYTHSDLAGNAATNPGEISGNGVDDDGNGYVDDVYGWDFNANDKSVYDGTGDDHGTHVAGTIGGQGGNGIGVAGVNWNVSLLSGKFLGSTGGTTANAIKAVDYFTDLKTRHRLNLVATNNSWGGGGYSQGLYDAIARANTAGIFFVAAAGNSSTSTTSYPAAYDLPNVISVASLDSNGGLSSFSNFSSTWVDLAAPGGGVYSTLPDNTYGTYSGTSMATPHVTGALALMRSAQPTATMAQLKQALLESVVLTPSLAGKTVTGGRLDVNGALTRLSQLIAPDPNAPTYAASGPSSVNEGSGLTLTVSTTNVAAGTPLYWKISGNGISTTDFVGLSSLQGSLAVDASGSAVWQTTVAADLTSEGNETLSYDVFSDAGLTTRVTGVSVLLNDTSQASGLTLWGTTASDTITGGGGPDRLAGVRATGTTAADLGAGQIDVLTGLSGADVFLLGDSRGVFYDDRVAKTVGGGDYALIKDFASGIDKLQVRAGTSYLYTVASGNLSLYWDRNNNGGLNTSGKNQDELIAVLQGVTTLASADLIGV
ncbi:MAG: S8 family serine peptidase [Cyanobacteriota bacterium]|jgi:subtilisin family serine protease